MAKEIVLIKNRVTGVILINPYSKDRKEFFDWPSAKKILIEENKGRKIELYTNFEDEIINELESELKLVKLKRLKE
jgi:hypothetical protein